MSLSRVMSNEILSMAYSWLDVFIILENGTTYDSADCERSVTCLVILLISSGLTLSRYVRTICTNPKLTILLDQWIPTSCRRFWVDLKISQEWLDDGSHVEQVRGRRCSCSSVFRSDGLVTNLRYSHWLHRNGNGVIDCNFGFTC
jgi:hypothetical protein